MIYFFLLYTIRFLSTNQVSLKLIQIDIESSIESKRSCNRRDNLTNQTVKVGVAGTSDSQIPLANIVDCFIINHKSTVRMFQRSMSSKDRVVGLWLFYFKKSTFGKNCSFNPRRCRKSLRMLASMYIQIDVKLFTFWFLKILKTQNFELVSNMT